MRRRTSTFQKSLPGFLSFFFSLLVCILSALHTDITHTHIRIEKISGFEMIKARTDEFLDEFQQHYFTLLDVVEFKVLF